RKTDKPEGERTIPDVPKPLPPDEAENEDLIVTQDSGPFEGEVQAEPPSETPAAPQGRAVPAPRQPPAQPPPRPPSSSAVNLGRSGSPAQSGQTPSGEIPSDPWTDLLRESHDSGPGEPARFDHPSDAEI